MKVLVIGGGGREHALAWKLAQSERVQAVFLAPGNAGTASALSAGVARRGAAAAGPGSGAAGGGRPVRNVPFSGLQALADFAADEKIGLTVVGPEAPLAMGVVDLFRARGLRIVGPTQAAARLESSKAFAKDFMARHRIPTAPHASFADAEAAHAHVQAHGAPIVIKADGLAAGKGVVVAQTVAEAHAALDAIFAVPAPDGADAGAPRVVIEAFMAGEEASFIVLCDGRHVVTLATSQDHKRIGEGDTGPNTGGMGAYSPAPVVTPNVHARVMQEIVLPTVAGMAAEGTPFTGFLYAGLMIDAQGQPRTVEFNCRLGDPEAQVILMRLKSDLLELLLAAADGTLDRAELQWDRRTALGIVVAAAGYPEAPRTGDAITALPADAPDLHVFHAGTALADDGRCVTSGGRVLCVTALADSVKLAQQRAVQAVQQVQFDGAQWRRDIGHRALRGSAAGGGGNGGGGAAGSA